VLSLSLLMCCHCVSPLFFIELVSHKRARLCLKHVRLKRAKVARAFSLACLYVLYAFAYFISTVIGHNCLILSFMEQLRKARQPSIHCYRFMIAFYIRLASISIIEQVIQSSKTTDLTFSLFC